MEPWKPDRLLKLVLIWSAVTLLPGWLPLVRGAFDGPTYQWAWSLWGLSASGQGVSGDYWLPVALTMFGVTLLGLGWRDARDPFPWLLVGWHALLFLDAVYSSWTDPGRYRFRGDTLGIDISLAWAGPLLFGTFVALSLAWAARRRGAGDDRPVASWSRANSVWLGSLVALLPVQFALLRFGPPHGTSDQIGVLLTIAQWLLLGVALKPR